LGNGVRDVKPIPIWQLPPYATGTLARINAIKLRKTVANLNFIILERLLKYEEKKMKKA